MLDTMEIEVLGLTPLILHNGQGANPLNHFSKKMKAITSKRNKTAEDLQELLMIQWESSLYWNDELGLYMPSENLFSAFHAAAMKFKLGRKCSAISFPEAIGYKIFTDGHMDYQQLKDDPRNKFVKTVVVQRSKTVACRSIFHNWSMKFTLEFETNIFDPNEIKTVLSSMGSRVGFGVWRPGSPKPGSYGKFLAKSIKWFNSKTKETKVLDSMDK